MFKAIHNFFTEIRKSEESIRRRWLIIFTGASILIIFSFWMHYINVIVQAPHQRVAQETSRPGFFHVFGTGLTIVTKSLTEKSASAIHTIYNRLSSSHEITLEENQKTLYEKNLIQ